MSEWFDELKNKSGKNDVFNVHPDNVVLVEGRNIRQAHLRTDYR